MMTPPHATPPESVEEQQARADIISERLRGLLDLLPPGQRNIASLLSMGYTPLQVAEIRGTTVASVYGAITRIRETLAPAVDQ